MILDKLGMAVGFIAKGAVKGATLAGKGVVAAGKAVGNEIASIPDGVAKGFNSNNNEDSKVLNPKG